MVRWISFVSENNFSGINKTTGCSSKSKPFFSLSHVLFTTHYTRQSIHILIYVIYSESNILWKNVSSLVLFFVYLVAFEGRNFFCQWVWYIVLVGSRVTYFVVWFCFCFLFLVLYIYCLLFSYFHTFLSRFSHLSLSLFVWGFWFLLHFFILTNFTNCCCYFVDIFYFLFLLLCFFLVYFKFYFCCSIKKW